MSTVKSTLQRWHPGKLVILWSWGLALVLVALDVVKKVESPILGFSLLVILVGIPAFLSVVTWRWLGGRERLKEAQNKE